MPMFKIGFVNDLGRYVKVYSRYGGFSSFMPKLSFLVAGTSEFVEENVFWSVPYLLRLGFLSISTDSAIPILN